MMVVNETLIEIGAADKPTIVVFNKIDLYDPRPTDEDIFEDETIYDLDVLKQSWMAKMDQDVVFISAVNKTNLDELRALMVRSLEKLPQLY